MIITIIYSVCTFTVYIYSMHFQYVCVHLQCVYMYTFSRIMYFRDLHCSQRHDHMVHVSANTCELVQSTGGIPTIVQDGINQGVGFFQNCFNNQSSYPETCHYLCLNKVLYMYT